MTYSDTGKRETLSYRLKGGSEEDPGLWGHEYVRCVWLFTWWISSGGADELRRADTLPQS